MIPVLVGFIVVTLYESASNAVDSDLSSSWVWKIPWRRDRLPNPVFLGFSDGSDSKKSTCNAGNLGSNTGFGRSPGGGHGNPLQYSCLENLHGQRSLAGCSPWYCKKLDTTERWSMHALLILVYYDPLYICIINCIVSSFISDAICIISFISQSSLEFVNFINFFEKPKLFHWVFYFFFFWLISHLLLSCKWTCMHTHLYLTLWNPMDCSPPGSFLSGIFQARILEWIAISYSRRSSYP